LTAPPSGYTGFYDFEMKFNFNFKIQSIGAVFLCSIFFEGRLLLAASRVAAMPGKLLSPIPQMEEPATWKLPCGTVTDFPRDGHAFTGSARNSNMASKLGLPSSNLDGRPRRREHIVYRLPLRNRFRPLLREHWINPVLYFESRTSTAPDKSLLESWATDVRDDFLGAQRPQREKREAELKLILSSNFKGLERGRKPDREKNWRESRGKFGYAAWSRPLSLVAAPMRAIMPQNFSLAPSFTEDAVPGTLRLQETSHYFSPTVNFACPTADLQAAAGFRLTSGQPRIYAALWGIVDS